MTSARKNAGLSSPAGEGMAELSLLATRLARAIAEAEASPADLAGRAVVFRVGDSRIALPITSVREVVTPGPMFPIPRTPSVVRGLMNVRGRVVPVVDGRALLEARPSASAGDTNPVDARVVLLDRGDGELGLEVSAVEGIVSLRTDSPDPPRLVLAKQLEQLLEGLLA